MAWFARFARDSMLLAATLAAVPLALPLSLARGSAEGAIQAPAILHLRGGAVPLPSSTHTIVAGDTLWQISREWDLSVEVLAAANHMCPDDPLFPGRVLVVPGEEAPASRVTSSTSSTTCQQRILQGMDLQWPSRGWVSSRFGWRIHPIFGTREFHTGVDIAVPWGSPVRAARDGVVRFVGWMIGYGRLIIVDHENGLQTFYAHLSASIVGAGARVAQGELIGRVGSTGWSTGPHLFFEVRRYGVPLDPIRYLR